MIISLLQSSIKEIEVIKFDQLVDKLLDLSINAGKHILAAVIIYIVGRFLIKLINRVVFGMLERLSLIHI